MENAGQLLTYEIIICSSNFCEKNAIKKNCPCVFNNINLLQLCNALSAILLHGTI